MGILDSVKPYRGTAPTTGLMYFGNPEAESENLKGQALVDYFQDYLGILGEMRFGKFLFVGRKGTGKSAIAKFIKDQAEKSSDSYACLIRMSDLRFEKLIQSCGNSHLTEQDLIEWLILLNLAKLVVKSGSAKYTKEYEKLGKFLERNTGSVDIDQKELIERMTKQNGEINFDVLRHGFRSIIGRSFQNTEQNAPFYKMITPLKEILKWLIDTDDAKKNEFWILFDDLDVNYSINKQEDNDKLMNLLRMVRVYNTEFLGNNSKILIFIREDVSKHIVSKYSDSAKIINSNIIPINWYQPPTDMGYENNIPLKKLADKRIQIAFDKLGIKINSNKSPWSCLIDDSISYNGSSFKYILDYTFYRPRDIVTFLDAVRLGNYAVPLQTNFVKRALKKYIELMITEIKSELNLFFEDKEKNLLFNDIFPYIKNNDITYEQLVSYISQFDVSRSPEEFVGILLDYALIGFREGRKCYYNYREHSIPEGKDINIYSIIIPKCILYYYNEIQL